MKHTFARRVFLLALIVCLLAGLSAQAAPALRAYCSNAAVTTDASGKITGFYFRIGAQYGTAPYTITYTMTGSSGVSLSGQKTDNDVYTRVYGAFASDTYTFTARVTDAAGAQSSASMVVEYVGEDGYPQSTRVVSAVYPEAVRAQEIELSASAQTMRVGDTFELIATVLPSNAANKNVGFASTNSSVATVNQDGLITAVGAGSCKIICTAADGSGVTNECQMTVIQPVTGITLTPSFVTIPVGGTQKLTAQVLPASASNKEVTFISGNKEVAVVANDGTITGVDIGVVTISVTSKDDPTKIASCTVTVGTPVTGVEISPTAVELKTGSTLALSASVYPGDATNKSLVWSTDNADVASVDTDGVVKTWSAGTAHIYAAALDGSGHFASCTITVTGESVSKPTPKPTVKPTAKPDDDNEDEDEEAPEGQTAYVRTEKGGLNLRKKPSQSAKRIKVIEQDDALIVVTKGSTWCYVWHDGDYGYVMTKFLSIYKDSSSSGSEPPSDGKAAKVDTEKGGLNLRKKPNQGATILRVIPEDAEFTVVTHGSSWCYAWYKGTYGYVMTKFVDMLDGSGDVTPEEPDEPDTPDEPSVPADKLYGVVTTKDGRLNLRKKASSSAAILKRIDPGKVVTVLDYGSKWCRVDYKGTKGYVMTKFLTFSGTKPEEKPVEPSLPDGEGEYAQVTTEKGSLNLRASKSTGAKLLKRIPQNAYVQVLDYGKTWCCVNYNGTEGYAMTKFLTFMGDVPSGSSGSTSTKPPQSNGQKKYAQVVTEEGRLNLRNDKSQSATIIGRIPQKAYVQVLTTGTTWCYVDYNGKTGYVMTKFLSFAKLMGSSEGLQPALIKSSGKIYKEKSTSSSKLAEVAAGDYVYLYTDDGTWAHVLHLGKAGYIKSDCLTLPEGVATVGGLKVYEGRTYSYENDSAVLATLSAGDTVKILHCYGDTWWLVRLNNGIEGYVTTEDNLLKVSRW